MSHDGFFQARIGQVMKLTTGSKTSPAAGGDRSGNRKGIGEPSARYVAGPHGEAAGDDFRERMIAFLPRLSGFAYALTGNADQRDDLVQETCARALANRDKWQPGTRLDSWMFRIAQNLWLDRKRADRFRGEAIDVDAVDMLVGSDGRAVMENRLELAAVLRGLEQLSPEHRVLIALVCVDGLTYQEAAEVLKVPVGTVMSRLARARLAIHDAINGAPAKATTTMETRRVRSVR
jgi:RNA polymerase sigma-70 factor (ECF subfamily)